MQENLKDISQKHGIVLTLKFGSSVTGRAHPKCDVDLAILLDRSNITLLENMRNFSRVFNRSSRIANSISP